MTHRSQIQSEKSGRPTSRDIVINSRHSESLKEIVEIKESNKYSIIVDESTDVTTTKILSIVVRIVNTEKSKVDDWFMQLLIVENSGAEGLYQLLSNLFETKRIFWQICLALLLVMHLS